MRKPIIAANWKMHKTVKEALDFVEKFKALVAKNNEVDIILCVPYTALASVAQSLNGSKVNLGAQNMYYQDKGAFTGEIAPAMLLEFATRYVLIGHSERREIFGETNELISEKVNKALQLGIIPILCVGETLEERENGLTDAKCKKQIEVALKGLNKSLAAQIIIAYEPIWAIGTGKTASSNDAEETIAYIRRLVAEIFDETTAQTIRIQYGGSVKSDNIKELMTKPNIDGALVGGASLDAESFAKIVNFKE
ncbi:MAG: triosephosphate isomerase [Peptococcaceae bacterium BICA1-8]|nr:MAG: triosephosphate isomerase [Peptococcaceae bacterium BICA1-8]